MKLGQLRHLVEIQGKTLVQDLTSGAMVAGPWVRVARVYASFEPVSTRDFVAASAAQAEVIARFVIRYRPGVDTTMRVLHRSKIYSIEGVLADKVSGFDYLTLPVSEGVKDGG